MVNYVSAPLASTRRSKLRILFQNNLLDGNVCKFFSFPYFLFVFLIFNHYFIVYVDFTRIVASNTASDDATN